MGCSKPIKIAFLLGSGISIPAGIPKVSGITKRVLCGDGVVRRYEDGNYQFNPGTPKDQHVERIVSFLSILRQKIDRYYSREPNYEDLYYLAAQIRDNESGNYDNPAVQPFADEVRKEFMLDLEKLWELADESTTYIKCIVWRMLSLRPSLTDHLAFIKDACGDPLCDTVYIFTLNHDTLVENYLSENKIDFCDGFGKRKSDVRYWEPDSFDLCLSKVKLVKLHGSINWFEFMTGHGDLCRRIGIPLTPDIEHTTGPDGKGQETIYGRPMLLIGTFNKMLRYTIGMFTQLYCQFYRSLSHANQLVICGYGFGDKAINARISEWIDSSTERRAVVIDPDLDGLRKRARGAIAKHWDDWEQKGKLVVISKVVEKVKWHEIRDSLPSIDSL